MRSDRVSVNVRILWAITMADMAVKSFTNAPRNLDTDKDEKWSKLDWATKAIAYTGVDMV